MSQSPPRIINTYRERASPDAADQRDKLVVRVDRPPTDAEARDMLQGEELRVAREECATARVEGIRDAVAALAKDKRNVINWADLARDYDCGDLYQTLYRMLSNDGTHVSVSAIVRRFEQGADGAITMMKCGPDTEWLVSALNAATTSFLNAIEPFLKLYPNAAHSVKLASLVDRFKAMRVEELDWNAGEA